MESELKIAKILKTGVKYKASDIYITVGIKPTLRINGRLVEIEEHPILTKTMAEEYIAETMTNEQKKEFAENFDIDFGINIPGVSRFRANIYIQKNGIGAVFRTIPDSPITLDELNLPTQLKKIIDMKQGIVLLTGPTGSGKSTTLAALLDEINRKYDKNILTIEDPIEFIHENKKSMVNQREVGTHTRTYANALKAGLRESTDVIMLGEMRDLETIALALRAAETGHLVISTLHTAGAAKSIDRVIDAFPPEQQNQIRTQFAESLRAIIWQQLLPRADGTGRVAAIEILFSNHAVANLIRKNKIYQIQSVIETGMKDGMQTMEHSVNSLLSQGFIDQKTALEYMEGLDATFGEE